MITKEELTALMADLESDRIERTESVNNTDKFSQAVCAFANDLPNHKRPGYLVIGVDKLGKPCGINVTEQLLENLGALRSNGNIQPLPVIHVAKITLEGGDVAVVEVQPSDLPPLRYKGQVWVRVGPRKATASEQEERILTEKRISKARSYDASPVGEASLTDLSLTQFQAYRQEVIDPEVIAANHRSVEDQLASLRFFDNQHHVPTVAGMLLFGKNPRFYLPGAYIQFLRLPGNTLTDRPDDEAEISGDLLSVLRELDIRVAANIQKRPESTSILREKNTADYPDVAIREILLNAIMHRDYQSNTPVKLYWFSDHIEIHSPGGLYGEVTPATLEKRSSYRNPVLAEAMKALGYVNRYGYGIQRAKSAMEKNGNPPIQFEVDERIFLATLPVRNV
ncbi:ATP-binding protein [Cellvibrio japonicus]|uniref:Putative ATP-dependent DNA helicase n=1 Tax=Cellvibrio japonicus (strain Ueda107) TaxID=498211 RepID=B3PE68_CELJU|nr:ATP-binding protein [Cellvibrio japonicus]ACE85820.1 putative ATP-dependent DNA helicase [Cellvibrio japonicus Ueda107]QEI12112.1 transcriptional regulator [Cellvibrio japonicus]QEI15686.1 transcriptional regulator [Cellvibrio japonicus]QEI19264.1 transcriptional regulator [Cellvibrio japonicus]